ncbi:MAG: TlpA family protein disulfide reductase [bacterium]|nr:TlpA family protein disulfide reductase [bacterium]
MKKTIVLLTVTIMLLGCLISCKKNSDAAETFTPSGNVGYNVADTATNFTEMGSDGALLALEDFRGKVIVLTFGAMWCGPCRSAVPELVRLYNTYKDQGLVILECVYQDEDSNPADLADLARWMGEFGIPYPVFNDDDRSTVNSWGFNAIPFNIVIDRNFVIRDRIAGYTAGAIENLVKKLL